eukprot:TRINITY_DN10808_c0_g1_i2.p1 TRINITY_DN10808_c0_g1~~TRINITY_DN10808_c0_g1_i2.p1  ORF type:complete len:384 (-),score=83.96 TRINITY_DN10808_c0_g1_i2:23-1174(-)
MSGLHQKSSTFSKFHRAPIVTNLNSFGEHRTVILDIPDDEQNSRFTRALFYDLNARDEYALQSNLSALHRDSRVPSLTCFANAAVDPEGRVFNGTVWIDPHLDCHEEPKFKLNMSIVAGLKWQTVSKPVFTISSPLNYKSAYHVVLDRVSRLTEYYEEILGNDDILIHIWDEPKVRAFLKLLGVSESRIISGAVKAPIVLYPKLMLCREYGPYSLNKLRDSLQANVKRIFGDELLRPSQHILVLRRSGQRRNIVNHDAMLQAIKENFPMEKVVEFTDEPLPPLEVLLRMFYEAKVIVGAHGAGLTNLVVCNPGVGVVELLPRVSVDCFRQMSQLLRLEYEGIVVQNSSTNDFPMTVNTRLVMEMIHRRLVASHNVELLLSSPE